MKLCLMFCEISLCVCVSKQAPYRIKELSGQAQVVMQRQEGHPLQAHHDYLEHTRTHCIPETSAQQQLAVLNPGPRGPSLSCMFFDGSFF